MGLFNFLGIDICDKVCVDYFEYWLIYLWSYFILGLVFWEWKNVVVVCRKSLCMLLWFVIIFFRLCDK